MTNFVGANQLESVRLEMWKEFDIRPRVSGERPTAASRRKDKRRKHANRVLDEIATVWNLSDGNMSEEDCIRVAFLGTSFWMFFLRLFLEAVAKWVFQRLKS